MNVGFTGTRHQGLSDAQDAALHVELANLWEPFSSFHNGLCVKSDEEASDIARELGYLIHHHPGHDTKGNSPYRAHTGNYFKLNASLPYIQRNHIIVNRTKVLIATPRYNVSTSGGVRTSSTQRSGTWATIRYARRQGKRTIVIYPDGITVTDG